MRASSSSAAEVLPFSGITTCLSFYYCYCYWECESSATMTTMTTTSTIITTFIPNRGRGGVTALVFSRKLLRCHGSVLTWRSGHASPKAGRMPDSEKPCVRSFLHCPCSGDRWYYLYSYRYCLSFLCRHLSQQLLLAAVVPLQKCLQRHNALVISQLSTHSSA